MITTTDFMNRTLIIKRLKEMGLSLYETKSYLSLLEKDTLTVSEISKIAEIPRTSAYEALEKLLAKGLCVLIPGNTKRYGASDPILLKDKFLSQIDQKAQTKLADLAKKEKEIIEKHDTAKEADLLNLSIREKEISEKSEALKDNIIAIIEEIKPKYLDSRSNGNPLEYIEILKDAYQIHRRFMELTGGARNQILIISKPPYSGPKEKLAEQYSQQAELLKRGIRIRCIYEFPDEGDELEWWYKSIDFAAGKGEEARVGKDLPMKMAIFDEKIVMLPLIDPVSTGTSFTSQVVEHASFARGLRILFDTLWQQAEDYHVLEDLLKKSYRI